MGRTGTFHETIERYHVIVRWARRWIRLWLLISLSCLALCPVYADDRYPVSFLSTTHDELPPWHADTLLRIATPSQEFLLGSSEFSWERPQNDGKSEMTERRGLAPETVGLTWVVPRLLAWVRWETCAEGTGRFIEEGHLMLLASGTEWNDVFRHQFEALVRSDDGEFMTTRLTVSKRGEKIVVQKTHDVQQACENTPRVWSRIERQTWRESSRRLATVRTVEEWRYRIASGSLEYVDGRSFFDAGKRGFLPGDLAEAFMVDISILERRNPTLAPKRRWRGIVVLDDALPDCRCSDADKE